MSVTGPKDRPQDRIAGFAPFSNARDLADRAPKSNDDIIKDSASSYQDVLRGQSSFVFAQGDAPPAPAPAQGGFAGTLKFGEAPLTYLKFKSDTKYTEEERKWLDQGHGINLRFLQEVEKLLGDSSIQSLPYYDKIKDSVQKYLDQARLLLKVTEKVLSGELPSQKERPYNVYQPTSQALSDAQIQTDAKIEFDEIQKKALKEFIAEFETRALTFVEPKLNIYNDQFGIFSDHLHDAFPIFKAKVKDFLSVAEQRIKRGERVFTNYPLESLIHTGTFNPEQTPKDAAESMLGDIAMNTSPDLHYRISEFDSAQELKDELREPAAPAPAPTPVASAPADVVAPAPAAPPAPAPAPAVPAEPVAPTPAPAPMAQPAPTSAAPAPTATAPMQPPTAPAPDAPVAPAAPEAPAMPAPAAPAVVANNFKERIRTAFEQSETIMNVIDETISGMEENLAKIKKLEPANPAEIKPLRVEAEKYLGDAKEKQKHAKSYFAVMDVFSRMEATTERDATITETNKSAILDFQNDIGILKDSFEMAFSSVLTISGNVQAQVDELKRKASASSIEAGQRSVVIKNIGEELQRIQAQLNDYKTTTPASMKNRIDAIDKLSQEIDKKLKAIEDNKGRLLKANSELNTIALLDPAKQKTDEITRLSETIVKDAESAEALSAQAQDKLDSVTRDMFEALKHEPPLVPAIFVAVALGGGKKVVWKKMTEDAKAFVNPGTGRMVKGFIGEEGKTKISVNFESTQDSKSNDWSPLTMKIGNGAKKPLVLEKDQSLLVYQQGGAWKSKPFSGTPNDFVQFAISEKVLKIPAKPDPKKSSYFSFDKITDTDVLRKPCAVQKQADGKTTDIVMLNNNQIPPSVMGFGAFYQCPGLYQYAPLTSTKDEKSGAVTASLEPWVWLSGADRLIPESPIAERKTGSTSVRVSYKTDVDFLNQLIKNGSFAAEPDIYSTAVQLEKTSGGNYTEPVRCNVEKSSPENFGPKDKKMIQKSEGYCKIGDQKIPYESAREFKMEAVDKKDANQGTRFTATKWETKFTLPNQSKPVEVYWPAMTLAALEGGQFDPMPFTPGVDLEPELQKLSDVTQAQTYYGKAWSLSVGMAMAQGTSIKVTPQKIDDPTLPDDVRRSYERLLKPKVEKKEIGGLLLAVNGEWQPDFLLGLSTLGEITLGAMGPHKLFEPKLGLKLSLKELSGIDIPVDPSIALLLPILPLDLAENTPWIYDSFLKPEVNVCLKGANLFSSGIGLEGCLSFSAAAQSKLADGTEISRDSIMLKAKIGYDKVRGKRSIERK